MAECPKLPDAPTLGEMFLEAASVKARLNAPRVLVDTDTALALLDLALQVAKLREMRDFDKGILGTLEFDCAEVAAGGLGGDNWPGETANRVAMMKLAYRIFAGVEMPDAPRSCEEIGDDECDECDGSGRYFIDGEPQACICSEDQDDGDGFDDLPRSGTYSIGEDE